MYSLGIDIGTGGSRALLLDSRGNVIGLITSRLKDAAQLSTTGFVAQNVNYGVKSSVALEGMPSLPRRSTGSPTGKVREPSEIAHAVEMAVAMVVSYR